MSRALPPIDSLRAFASAARTASFKRAAAELHLSASALSRRIAALEEHLGTPLFRRMNPGIELTEAGERYRATVEDVIARLEAAQTELVPARVRRLRLSTLVSFSETWLIPHLPEFERAHPEVAIEVEATLRYADFQRDAVDAAIRFGTGPWEGLHSEPLTALEFFPVCAPALVQGESPLREPRDLARHALIHLTQTPLIWRAWLRQVGQAELEPQREVRYDHVALALSAAESGQGVALGTSFSCASRLNAGRLCRPFTQSVPSSDNYHFVCRPDGLADPVLRALRDWLVERLR